MLIKIQRQRVVYFIKLDQIGEDDVPSLCDLRVGGFVGIRVSAGILHFDVMMGKDIDVDRLTIFGEGGDQHFDKDVVLFGVTSFLCDIFDEMWFPFIEPDFPCVFIFKLDEERLRICLDSDEIGDLNSEWCTE